jgi:hypothetical protein
MSGRSIFLADGPVFRTDHHNYQDCAPSSQFYRDERKTTNLDPQSLVLLEFWTVGMKSCEKETRPLIAIKLRWGTALHFEKMGWMSAGDAPLTRQ